MSAVMLSGPAIAGPKPASLTFVCSPENDLYWATTSAQGLKFSRCATIAEALAKAAEGSGVLVLADEYPAKTTAVDESLFEAAAKKRLRLYVEFPSALPNLKASPVRRVTWERAVVTSDVFGAELARNRLLMVHDCHFVPYSLPDSHLALARVAGFDTAVYGLPSKGVWPLLFEHPRGDLLVATTKLSQFVTARYGLGRAWTPLWQFVFKWLANGAEVPRMHWTQSMTPSYQPSEPLPADARLKAVQRGVDWFTGGRLLAHADWADPFTPKCHPVLSGWNLARPLTCRRGTAAMDYWRRSARVSALMVPSLYGGTILCAVID